MACMTMKPATTALVVAMAGMILPAISAERQLWPRLEGLKELTFDLESRLFGYTICDRPQV